MKKNPFAYLKRAPKIKGYRILKPTEKAREGDRFLYLHALDVCGRPGPETMPHVIDGHGYIRLGRTLAAARLDGISCWGQYDEDSFDGVIYRPLKK